jgi:hypothetical protein
VSSRSDPPPRVLDDDPDQPDCTAWEQLAFGRHQVVVHRSAVTTLGARGVRRSERYDWFADRDGADRWVAFHRSEHRDATTALAVLVAAGRDLEWQEQLLGRRLGEVLALPVAIADLQRAAIAGYAGNVARLRAALPDERAEIAGLAPAACERPPAPEDLPPLTAALPADPAADRIVLTQVLPPATAHALNRHGLVTLLDAARLTRSALLDLPGLDDLMRRDLLAALRTHGLLLAPERSRVSELAERRDGRRRQAARFAELIARGYDVQQIAEHARRSVGYVRMVLGDRAA